MERRGLDPPRWLRRPRADMERRGLDPPRWGRGPPAEWARPGAGPPGWGRGPPAERARPVRGRRAISATTHCPTIRVLLDPTDIPAVLALPPDRRSTDAR